MTWQEMAHSVYRFKMVGGGGGGGGEGGGSMRGMKKAIEIGCQVKFLLPARNQ